MHVGKGIFFQNLDGLRSDSEVLAEELALAEIAEGQGFGSLWAAEHHFSGYHMCPSVTQVLTWLAAKTQHVRLGSMVVVLPWHEPVRVAEELAMLDHLSGGRLVVGFGRGLGRIEFDGFRLQMSESRQRFSEYAEAIVEAFDEGIMAYDGDIYHQPPVALRPKPLMSLRGRVYAAAVSPASFELCARLGIGIMVIAQKPWETTEAEVNGYRERYIQINGSEPPAPLLVSIVAVHDSPAGAEDLHRNHTVTYARSCADHYQFQDHSLAQVPGYEYYAKIAENIADHGLSGYVNFLADLQVHGTPDAVVEQLTDYVRRLDAAGVVVVTSFGGMEPEVARANQDLFTRKVLPRLTGIDPHRALLDTALGAKAAMVTGS